MSKLAAGYLIVAGAIPELLHGQDLRLMRDRLQRESAKSARLSAELADYRSPLRLYRTATDTVVIANGNITVLSHRGIAAEARAAAAQSDSVLRQVGSLLPLVRGAVVYVERDTSGGRDRAQVTYGLPPYRNVSRVDADVDATDIARQIEGTTMSRIGVLARTRFTAWRQGNFPLRQSDLKLGPDWSAVRFEVLESPSLLGPRCYKGDLVACSMQLGFTPVDDPVMAWYDSLTRHSTVKREKGRTARFDSASTAACLAGSDAACGRALHAIHMFESPPSGSISRDALTWKAIQMGGAGAVERLLTTRGSAGEAIAAAAKAPTDSVIRLWQRDMREDGIGSEDLSGRMVFVALGWVLVLLFLSTRISRWR